MRELYGNDIEKESFTGFSLPVPHKVSRSSLHQEQHAVASPIDQASTKKSPPYQGKYIVTQIYSIFAFCSCRLAIVWLLWPSFFICFGYLCATSPWTRPNLVKSASRPSFGTFGPCPPTFHYKRPILHTSFTSNLRDSIIG